MAAERNGTTYTLSLREDRERSLWLPEVEDRCPRPVQLRHLQPGFLRQHDYYRSW